MKGRIKSMGRMGVRRSNRGEMEEIVSRLREFLEDEARSGSMDFGCVTPLYVYRSWGGTVSINEIETGLKELRSQGFMMG